MPRIFADTETPREWVETRNLQVFTMHDPGSPLLTVDLFAREPIPFDDLWSRAETIVLGSRKIRVAALDDLIAMKRVAARPQDLLDIEKLETIARKRRED